MRDVSDRLYFLFEPEVVLVTNLSQKLAVGVFLAYRVDDEPSARLQPLERQDDGFPGRGSVDDRFRGTGSRLSVMSVKTQ